MSARAEGPNLTTCAGVRTEVACRASNTRGSQNQMEIGSPSRESLVGPGTCSVVPAKQRSDGRRIKDPPPMHAAGELFMLISPRSQYKHNMHAHLIPQFCAVHWIAPVRVQ